MADTTSLPDSAAEAIRLMAEFFQASVEHNASRHAWLPPDAIKEHYYPHRDNVRGEYDARGDLPAVQ
jgi:hypothetical protein